MEYFNLKRKRGSILEMTHFFNNRQVLMENVSFQELSLKLFRLAKSKLDTNLDNL